MNNKALSTSVDWSSVENQSDLDKLVESVYGSDAQVFAFAGNTDESQAFFPTDVARSGHQNWNIRILVQIEAATGKHIESFLSTATSFPQFSLETLACGVGSIRSREWK